MVWIFGSTPHPPIHMLQICLVHNIRFEDQKFCENSLFKEHSQNNSNRIQRWSRHLTLKKQKCPWRWAWRRQDRSTDPWFLTPPHTGVPRATCELTRYPTEYLPQMHGLRAPLTVSGVYVCDAEFSPAPHFAPSRTYGWCVSSGYVIVEVARGSQSVQGMWRGRFRERTVSAAQTDWTPWWEHKGKMIKHMWDARANFFKTHALNK